MVFKTQVLIVALLIFSGPLLRTAQAEQLKKDTSISLRTIGKKDLQNYASCMVKAKSAKSKKAITQALSKASKKGKISISKSCVIKSSGGAAVVAAASGPTAGPSCVLTLAGDVDRNGVVELSDLMIVANCYGKTASQCGNPNADLDGDGRIATNDLLIVSQNYGQRLCPATPTVTPLIYPQTYNSTTNLRVSGFVDGQEISTQETICLHANNVGRVGFRINNQVVIQNFDYSDWGPICLSGRIGNDILPISLGAGTYSMIMDVYNTAGILAFSRPTTFRVTATGTPPTPTATPTSSPTVINNPAPIAHIDTLNTIENGVIVGEAPLSVFVKAITTFADLPAYQSCLDIVIPRSTSGGNYVPVGDPNHALWEQKGDERSRCLDSIANQVISLSSQGLRSRGSLMTAGYQWDFGDSASGSVFNKLDGWNAAHTYNQPGWYSLNLKVTNVDGVSSTQPMSVYVKPSTRRTFYVSQFGNDSSDGLGIDRPVRTIARVASLTYGKTNFDLLFKRGETFVFNPNSTITFNKPNIHVGAYGTGEMPLMLWQGAQSQWHAMFNTNHLSADVLIENLRFDTDLQGLFGTSQYNEKDGVPNAVNNSGKRITFRNNDIKNINSVMQQTAVPACDNNVCVTVRPTGTLLVQNTDSLLTGIRGYFLWNGSGEQANLYGNTVVNSTREHIVRSADSYIGINAQFNTFRNTKVDGNDDRKGILVSQGGAFAWYANNNIDEGPAGFATLGVGVGLRGEKMRFGKFLANNLDARATNILRTGPWGGASGFFLGDAASHIVVANNMFEMSNGISVTGYDTAIDLSGYSAEFNRAPEDITIAHNTFSTTYAAHNRNFLRFGDGYRSVKVANNLMLHPAFDAGDNYDPPFIINASGDALTSPLTGIDLMSCNTFPIPATFRSQPFNQSIHGINQISGVWLTIAQWINRFSGYHGTNGTNDRFQSIGFVRTGGDAIPEASESVRLQCPAVEGVRIDKFGAARRGIVTAGAYEFN